MDILKLCCLPMRMELERCREFKVMLRTNENMELERCREFKVMLLTNENGTREM